MRRGWRQGSWICLERLFGKFLMENELKNKMSTEKGNSFQSLVPYYLRAERNILEVPLSTLVQELDYYGMVSKSQFLTIVESSISILKFEPNIIQVTSPVVVVGDIHGQFHDLLNIFTRNGYPPACKYVFLGDYVDRGDFNIQVITLLFWLKLKFPKYIILLRGNHQSRVLTSTHNFRIECKNKYNLRIYQMVALLFEVLPISCIVDSKYFCVHAGISPQLQVLDQLQKMNRFVEIPQKGMLCDLLWSDPIEQNKKEWTFNTTRSCSYFYSRQQAFQFLHNNKLKAVIRGHEVQLRGYKYQEVKKSEKMAVLTVFSAPNYCNKYKNLGAVIRITPELISTDTFSYIPHPDPTLNLNILEWSFKQISKNVAKIFLTLMTVGLNTSSQLKDLSLIKEKMKVENQIELFKTALSSYAQPEDLIIACKPEKQDNEDDASTDCVINILQFMALKKSDSQSEAMPLIKDRHEGGALKVASPNQFLLALTGTPCSLDSGSKEEECREQWEKQGREEDSRIIGPKIRSFTKVNIHRKLRQ